MGIVVTEHFTLRELITSQEAKRRGLDNYPPQDIMLTLKFTAAGMERIRAFLGSHPITITSGYRSPDVNKAVGGVDNSQHCKGEAIDFICPKAGGPRDIVRKLSGNMRTLGIDQLILEGMWVHVSFTATPRYQIYTLVGAGKYKKGIV